MKPTRTILALFVAVLALPMAAVGQDDAASSEVAPDDPKSMADLRRDVFQLEEDFYSLYNNYNDDREFSVRCFYEKPTGTRVKNHVCRARFVTNAYAKHASRNRSDLSRVANQDADAVSAEKMARYQENMETLVAANPDLQAALDRYNTARARFLAAREEHASN